MFCKNCGKEIDDEAIICPYCRTETENANLNNNIKKNVNNNKNENVNQEINQNKKENIKQNTIEKTNENSRNKGLVSVILTIVFFAISLICFISKLILFSTLYSSALYLIMFIIEQLFAVVGILNSLFCSYFSEEQRISKTNKNICFFTTLVFVCLLFFLNILFAFII